MSISINGAIISEVKLNNAVIEKVMLNGTTIFESVPPYYNELKNGIQLTESQWLAFLNGGGIEYIINKGEQSTFRGKRITVSNNQTSDYSTWIIADFNHDNTSNTCDVIQANTVNMLVFGNSSASYSSSNVRTWLTGTYYNGFSTNIKNKLQTMNVASNGSTLSDKVKILSGTEVSGSNNYMRVEGTKYPIFTSSGGTIADSARVRDGITNVWWLRSRYTNDYTNVWHVYNDGSLMTRAYNSSAGLVPVLRFA